MIRIALLLVALFSQFHIFAQSEIQVAIDRIRTDSRYRWGEARSSSLDEALEMAKDNLLSKMKTVIVAESTLLNDEFSSRSTAITAAVVENISELYYKDGNTWVAFVSVSQADIDRAERERSEMIKNLIDQGRSQEQQVNIAQALKYYTWSLRLLNLYNDHLTINSNGDECDAKTWLSNHIPAMLDKIEFEIPEEKIVDDPSEYDRYTVTVNVTYDGHPVSMLDFSYFNGEHIVAPVHCKSGEGVMSFPNIATLKNTTVRVLYDFPVEGRTYSPLVESVYPKNFRRLAFDDRASKSLPIKVNVDEVETSVSIAESPQFLMEKDAIGVQTLFTPERRTIERPLAENAPTYVEIMKRIEHALRSRDYQSVQNYFTPEGFRIFEQMTGSGRLTVTKNEHDFKVEQSGNYIVGRSIPVAIRNGKHTSKEDIVFRFSPTDGKITSVAYALTSRAENDIFREASWAMESRYALMQFMEDYQTAYALKRLDYIESVFSDNAVIIVGTVVPTTRKRLYNWEDMRQFSSVNAVSYKQYSKDAFMDKLKEDFRRKSYIQLTFEDTYISKVQNIEGLIDNDIIWIELNQDYQSSNYNDKGYLALQINMRPTGSLINVRTWTPVFVPINVLKQSFPIGD